MSTLQPGNTTGSHQLSTNSDAPPNRRVSDNFSSSRSYAPEYHSQSAYASQHRLCEQLREEARRERTKVSIVCKDLIRYVTDHQASDALVVAFGSSKENPFREKPRCSLL